jgi:hypothetical protein
VLIDAADSEQPEGHSKLSEYLPKHSAIYMWRRTIKAPPRALISPKYAFEWIIECVTLTVGKVSNQRVNHGLHIDLLFKPSDLTLDKRKTLHRLLENDLTRIAILKIIETMGASTPALYVGQASDVRRRVMQHLNLETDFGRSVENYIPNKWDDLEFQYLPFGQYTPEDTNFPNKPERELFEMIAAKLTIAAFTQRPG